LRGIVFIPGGANRSGRLAVVDSYLHENYSGYQGWAIDNYGSLAISRTSLLSNTAATSGGGLMVSRTYVAGQMVVDQSTLAEMTGFAERIEYRVADATALPVEEGSFAQVWMLDASVHIREKCKLFGEIARVLRPGGLLVLHDQMGPLGPAMRSAQRRAPWVAPPLPRFIRLVEGAGLRLLLWQDTTASILEWFYGRRAQRVATDAAAGGDSGGQRRPRSLTLLDGYIRTLESPNGRTGFLIAGQRSEIR
jgi:SAM-dependent methyltransferase